MERTGGKWANKIVGLVCEEESIIPTREVSAPMIQFT